jgi:hypothetical protein
MFRLTIDREWDARPAREGPRFRTRMRSADDDSILMMHTRLCDSIEDAIEHTEALFGAVCWVSRPDGGREALVDFPLRNPIQRNQIRVPSKEYV